MAYVIGYVTKEEKKILEERGWDVEEASRYNLTGDGYGQLLGVPSGGDQAVVIFVDSDVFKVMNGPDWDKGREKDGELAKKWAAVDAPEDGAGHDMDRCNKHHNHNCVDCHPGPEDEEER